MGRTMVAALAAAWLLSFTPVAQSDSLTTAEIEAAIKLGESGNAAPYLLHHAAQPGTTRDVVVGAEPSDFVIYRDIPNTINPLGPATEAQVGRITTADVQRWR